LTMPLMSHVAGAAADALYHLEVRKFCAELLEFSS
jgi:hypothetical protein